jgi:signal transduction histidine kinase
MTPARGQREIRDTEDAMDVVELDPGPDRAWSTTAIAELEGELVALESFAARAAHELVGPLVSIEAYTTSILDRIDTDDPVVLDDLERIARIAARSRRLVETLLYASRDEGGIATDPVDLGETVDEVAASLERDAEEREAHIDVDELPVVRGDAVLLASVFCNLLVNGLRYGRRRAARIRVHAERERSGEWRIMVDSDGTPIAPEDRERVFGAGVRGSHERRGLRGAGLGLAICRDIVERHGGRIGVSPLDGGNRFWLTLPEA